MAKITPAFGLVPFSHGAALLGVSTATAHRLLRKPTPDFPRPSIQIGRRRFYRSTDELQQWLDRRAAAAAAIFDHNSAG